MKTLDRLSSKAIQFCEFEGLDIEKVKKAMKCQSFAINRCENRTEMDKEGVDYSFPYVIWNPYNIDIKID